MVRVLDLTLRANQIEARRSIQIQSKKHPKEPVKEDEKYYEL